MALSESEWLLDELRRSGLTDRELGIVRKTLCRMGGERLYIPKPDPSRERIELAKSLRSSGRSASEIVEILQVRARISRTTAYRILWRATDG